MRDLLSYVVSEELAGRGANVKAYSIAVDALGKPDDFDAQTDSSVRVGFGRLRKSLKLYYSDEGEDDPVRIEFSKGSYRPRFEPQTQPASNEVPQDAASPYRFRKSPGLTWIAASAALAAILFVIYMANPFDRKPVGPPPHTPRLAIDTFEDNFTGQRPVHFAYGLGFDLVSELSRFTWLSVYVTRKRAVPVSLTTDLPNNLEVRPVDYLVTGTIGGGDKRLAVSYQLVDARTGIVRWAKTFEREFTAENVYDVQREAATSIAVEIGRPDGVVKQLELSRVRHSTRNLNAYVCTLRIYHYWKTFSPSDHLETRVCLESATKEDPNYAEAQAALSFIYLDEHRYATNVREGYDPLQRSKKAASLAVKLDPFSTLAKQALFTAELYSHNYAEFIRIGRSAISFSPNNPELLADFGNKLAIDAGEWEKGLKYSTKALTLNADPAPWYYMSVAYRAIVDGDYQSALQWSQRIHTPGWFPYHVIRAVGFSGSGDPLRTRAELDQLAALGFGDAATCNKQIANLQVHPALESVLTELMSSAFQVADKPD